MSVIDKALGRFPDTVRDDWRQVGEAAVHRDCTVGERAKFVGPAICRGGAIRGGAIRGGAICGGAICGGVIRGGVIRGGVIRGGEIRGGEIHGGVFSRRPIQIFGMCDYEVVIGAPGKVSVGCQCHTPDVWRKRIAAIARQYGVGEAERDRVMRCVELAAEWLAANPYAVTEETEGKS